MKISKKTFAIAGLISFIFLGLAATHENRGNHENLKVLPKDISNQDLDIVMEGFEKALGMDCKFCHVKSKKDTLQWDYASDERPEKEITRKMMKMTEMINKEFFDYTMVYKADELLAVSCNTCHGGSPRPELREEKKD